MIAELFDDQKINLYNCSAHEDDVLWREFSVSRPGIGYVDPSVNGLWDGVYRFYNRSRQTLARPLLAKLIEVCTKHQLPLTIRDVRPETEYPPTDPETVGPDFLPGITLETWQIDAIRQACTKECGLIDMVTGSGKGEIAAGICKAIQCPTVIIADQVVVIDQLKDRLELRMVIEEVGVFYAGKRPDGQLISIGTVQSLTPPTKTPLRPIRTAKDTNTTWAKKEKNYQQRMTAFQTRTKNARILEKMVKSAHMIIVDEADKAVSDPYKRLFQHVFKGRRRYGLSGTPFDKSKPVEAMRLQQHLGSVIAKVSRKTVEDAERIVPVQLFMLTIEGDKRESSAYDIAYREHMVESQYFHSLIANIHFKYPDEGTLILVDREELGVNIQAEFRGRGLEVPFIFGKTPKSKRTKILREFERREHKVLIGGKIINRGLDLSGGCENLVIATGGKLWSEFNQKVGRAVRKNSNGKARIFDFYFRCNKYLYDHSRSRLKAMVDMGYKTTVVFESGKVDGSELISSRFVLSKKLLDSYKKR